MYIIGSDEVGYGAWAGPLYVCAYVAEEGWTVPGLNDSKALSKKDRLKVYRQLDLTRSALYSVEPSVIDEYGVYHCLVRAHVQAIQELLGRGFLGARIIVDGKMHIPLSGVESIAKADTTVPAVMAASIIAKCCRDEKMGELGRLFPEYGFASHVGYGTPEHMAALQAYGPTPSHRFSYRPIRNLPRRAS